MDQHYQPDKVEEKWYSAWTERGLFHGDVSRGGEPYCVVIPPPNVTGILHMGHALNNTIQDILVRWRRMQGRNVVWLPGTDHAGIATQNVVERALRAEDKCREDLGRDAFVERVWEWREKYGGTIIRQLKRLGCSCDWERERFTMDDGLSDAVAEVFVRLYDKGLIYRGNYIVNWCCRCRTALSDEESEHAETNGKLYYIRYPVRPAQAGGDKPEFIVVATTRPETLLGDVAVAVNPADTRYADLPSKTVVLPILDRELSVIEDDFVDPEFGTGIVKVTPAHDPNDFEMGQRHKLTPINVMNGDGTMNEQAGPYVGMDRFECRKKILADLEAAGLLEKTVDHVNAIGHCYRCDTVVEPRLSKQWFVRMKPLAEPALAAVRDGRIRFVPERWTKVYEEWMENIRDWCISRQIWWGHRIPVFTCAKCEHVWAAKGVPAACPACGAVSIGQDEDVLDTWFSSWLWPFSTFGWPESSPDLDFYYPSHDMVTASEIIFFWVARMIMAGLEFRGDIPFRTVYIHGTVRDDVGRKMSKSIGNIIDPLTVIEEFSADALRFSLMMITATGQDVFLSSEKFEIGRNFGTKIWNAARFMHIHAAKNASAAGAAARRAAAESVPDLDPGLLSADDRYILCRLDKAIREVTGNLERFRFNGAALSLYEFLWHQYCDWHVESVKPVLYGAPGPCRDQVLRLMHFVFSTALRLLQPFMPFLTEELWHVMGYAADRDSILVAPWPAPFGEDRLRAWGVDDGTVGYVDGKHEMIRVARMLGADYGIVPGQVKDLTFLVKPGSAAGAGQLAEDRASVESLLKAAIKIDADLEPDAPMASGLTALGTVYLPLEGLIDVDRELERVTDQLTKLSGHLRQTSAKLENESFVRKAPEHVVAQQRKQKLELAGKIAKFEQLSATLTTLRDARKQS